MDDQRLLMKYFVLTPWSDGVLGKASRAAMEAYARVVEFDFPNYAEEIRDLVTRSSFNAADEGR